MTEIWKPTDIAPYEVSNMGNIRNANRDKLMNKTITGNGYERVTLRSGNTYAGREVHRLVAQAFLPNDENKRTVNHKNKIRYDNRVENLEWATSSEQASHMRNTQGELQYMPLTSIVYQPQSDEIWKDIPGTKLYEVSNYGFVRNKKTNYVKTVNVDGRGYASVVLHKKYRLLHRLVAETFLDTFTSKCVINHKDGTKYNNYVSNLECITQNANVLHAYALNLQKTKKKTKCICVNVNGIVKGSYESLAEAEAVTGINRGKIHHALANKSSTCGLKWYHTYEEYECDKDNIKTDIFTIYKCDMNGNILETFHNYPEASIKTGISKSNICRAVNRNKDVLGTAGGYIWYSNRVKVQHLLDRLKNEK